MRWGLLLVLLAGSVWQSQGENTTARGVAAPVLEAVDLQAAAGRTATADQLKQKEMQVLLHWAIGGSVTALMSPHCNCIKHISVAFKYSGCIVSC